MEQLSSQTPALKDEEHSPPFQFPFAIFLIVLPNHEFLKGPSGMTSIFLFALALHPSSSCTRRPGKAWRLQLPALRLRERRPSLRLCPPPVLSSRRCRAKPCDMQLRSHLLSKVLRHTSQIYLSQPEVTSFTLLRVSVTLSPIWGNSLFLLHISSAYVYSYIYS